MPLYNVSNFNTLKQVVLNQSGTTMALGAAVYVSGANGDNPVVSLAKADADATSSKTVGLLETSLNTGQLGNVIQEGLIVGLNTSSATVGDPVWLSPTVAGGLLYGEVNKPVAPAHMVFIGKVIKVGTSNGSVLVSTQNGFQLEELHNVSITSAANNDVLTYETSTNLWKNKQPTTSGGATDVLSPFLLMGA